MKGIVHSIKNFCKTELPGTLYRNHGIKQIVKKQQRTLVLTKITARK